MVILNRYCNIRGKCGTSMDIFSDSLCRRSSDIFQPILKMFCFRISYLQNALDQTFPPKYVRQTNRQTDNGCFVLKVGQKEWFPGWCAMEVGHAYQPAICRSPDGRNFAHYIGGDTNARSQYEPSLLFFRLQR